MPSLNSILANDEALYRNSSGDLDGLDVFGSFATVFNVTGYGAVGDGTTDDTDAVHDAIAAANAAGGGLVFLPGDHAVTGVVCDFDRIHFVGAGRHASALKAHASIVAGTDLLSVTAGYCSIRDLTLNANSLASDCLQVGAGGIRFVGHNIYIMGATAAGLHVVGTDSGANQAHGSQWTNVIVIDADAYGVLIEGFAYDSDWANLQIAQCGVGLRATSGSHEFTNLHVWGCTGNGVELTSNNNRVVGFHAENNGGDGINDSGDFNTFSSGEARDNTDDGLALSGDRTILSAVRCYDNDTGISIAGAGTRLSGVLSRTADNTTAGIADTGTGTIRDGSLYVRKTADEVVNASTTLQNDNDLALAVEANTDYIVDLTAFYMASQAADIKFKFTLPAGATIRWGGYGVSTGSVSNFAASSANATSIDESTFLTYGGATTTYPAIARMSGLLRIGATAGTAQLQWAQVASDATDTTVMEDSFLRLTPVT